MIRQLLDKDASAASQFKVTAKDSGCCTNPKADCKSEATVTFPVNSITFVDPFANDLETVVTFAVPATNATELEAYLRAFLDDCGYTISPDGIYQMPYGDGVLVTDEGATAVIQMVGDIDLTSINDNTGDVAFAKACDPKAFYVCAFSVAYSQPDADLIVEGANQAVGAIPAAGDPDGVQTLFVAALTALGVAFSAVNVTEITTNTGGSYQVEIASESKCGDLSYNATDSVYCSTIRVMVDNTALIVPGAKTVTL